MTKKITVLIETIRGLLEILPDCECDNTHEQNNTKCRICLAYELVNTNEYRGIL